MFGGGACDKITLVGKFHFAYPTFFFACPMAQVSILELLGFSTRSLTQRRFAVDGRAIVGILALQLQILPK